MIRFNRHRLHVTVAAAAAAVTLALGCTDTAGLDPFADRAPPSVELVQGAAAGDSVISFVANVSDNLGIKTVSITLTGGVSAALDTTFTSAVTSTSLSFRIPVPSSVVPGTAVTITAVAVDGAGNSSEPAMLLLGVGNLESANVRITSPTSGTIAIIGKSIVLSVSAKSALKIRTVGFQASGVVSAKDSTVFSSPLVDSVAIVDTLSIPLTALPGPLVLSPFSVDSLGQRTFGPDVTLTVQTAAETTTEPVVTFGLTKRIEVNDTIHVAATDPTGIVDLGYEITLSPGGPLSVADSITSNGSFSTLQHTFTMQLPYTTFPTQIFVRGFARNSNDKRVYSARTDTVMVVAGSTKALPLGGSIADVVYHPGKDRLYLSNIDRNRLEVFDVASGSFQTAISTGSRPWGIAHWPRNRLGNATSIGDTILVAHSGGTSIGYVNLNGSSLLSPNGVLVKSYPLPNIIVNTITTVQSSTGSGPLQQRTRYDFSDRPQYLAPTCRGPEAGPCEVALVYSTTPTGGQSPPNARRGTIRWENLTNQTSHFFFEHAVGQGTNRADTLEIIRYAAGGVGTDVALVPYTPGGGITVDIERIGFRDTTFARSSGDFSRAIFGEGGPMLGSRAMMYDATLPFNPGDQIDQGVSRAVDVLDITANAFSRVGGVAINKDGNLAAIRGDSTYLVDRTLRLQGLLQTSGTNSGFDFHPDNVGNYPGGVDPDACHSFAASSQPVIEVYENRYFARVAQIPVRDPIIGPIKSARRGGNIVLVGATASGVIMVELPDTYAGCPS